MEAQAGSRNEVSSDPGKRGMQRRLTGHGVPGTVKKGNTLQKRKEELH